MEDRLDALERELQEVRSEATEAKRIAMGNHEDLDSLKEDISEIVNAVRDWNGFRRVARGIVTGVKWIVIPFVFMWLTFKGSPSALDSVIKGLFK